MRRYDRRSPARALGRAAGGQAGTICLDPDRRYAKSLRMAEIEIYTQYFCPFCDQAKALLDRKGAAYVEHHAPSGSAARRAAAERSGGRSSVPQIFVGGQHVGGCDDLMALDRAGKLDPMLAG